MNSLFRNPVAISHRWLSEVLTKGMMAVDATAGNGHDTLFLAEKVGNTGTVYAFDIQKEALDVTKKRLMDHQVEARVKLIHAGHERLTEFIHHPINVMVFNLGYRPGGDKTVITRPETTIAALKAGMKLLLPQGLIVITVYTGHPGGLNEWESLKCYVRDLPKEHWDIVQLTFLNRHKQTPYNIGIQRID